MKVTNIKNIDAFFKAVDTCEGSVELVTGEGDRLNLKSNLCKYVSLAKVFSGDSGIKSIEIIVSEPKDVNKLMQFMIFGSTC